MAPFPSAFTNCSAREFRGGKWKKPFRQFMVKRRGCWDWG
jgi:hypothetical protein